MRISCVGQWCGATATACIAGNVIAISSVYGCDGTLIRLRSTTEIESSTPKCMSMFIAAGVLFVRCDSGAVLLSMNARSAGPMPPLITALLRNDAIGVLARTGSVWPPTAYGPLVNASHIAALMGNIDAQHILCSRGYYGYGTEKWKYRTRQQVDLHILWTSSSNVGSALLYSRLYPGASVHVARWALNHLFGPIHGAMNELALAARWGTTPHRLKIEKLPESVRQYYVNRQRPGNWRAIQTVLAVGNRKDVLPPELWAAIVSFMVLYT